ncbi:hypothetical protein JCM8547_001414 [Rhodosporidiobolus lusitaniae]
MGKSAYARVPPFYGLVLLQRSLVRAETAWRSYRSPLLFLDLITARLRPPIDIDAVSAAPAVERVPVEVWQLIRRKVIDDALDEAMRTRFDWDGQWCETRECYGQEGVRPFVGEMWDDFELSGALTREKKRREGNGRNEEEEEPVPSASTSTTRPEVSGRCRERRAANDFEEAVYLQPRMGMRPSVFDRYQRFLASFCFLVPAKQVLGRGFNGFKFRPYYLTFLAVPPSHATDAEYKKGSYKTVHEDDGGLIVRLNPEVPPGTDARMLGFVREWRLETSSPVDKLYEHLEGKEESIVEGGGEDEWDEDEDWEKKIVEREERERAVLPKPSWHVFAMCTMG